jgi:acyl-CoA reductase-like NAD-dependent aldehyde dehydrogenase
VKINSSFIRALQKRPCLSETWKRAPTVSRPPALTSTLFVNVKNDMAIAEEEIFGPMLHVFAYDSEDEAVGIANDSKYRSFSTLTKRA